MSIMTQWNVMQIYLFMLHVMIMNTMQFNYAAQLGVITHPLTWMQITQMDAAHLLSQDKWK